MRLILPRYLKIKGYLKTLLFLASRFEKKRVTKYFDKLSFFLWQSCWIGSNEQTVGNGSELWSLVKYLCSGNIINFPFMLQSAGK